MKMLDTHLEWGKGLWLMTALAVAWFAGVGSAAVTTEYTYSDAGDVLTTWTHDEVATNTLAYSTADYDALGRQTKTVQWADATNGLTTEYSYDVAGQLVTKKIKTDGASDFATVYEYDLLGRQVTVRGPSTSLSGGQYPEMVYEYDQSGNVTQQKTLIAADTYVSTHTEYDAANRVTKTTDPADHYRQTWYDSLGRAYKECAYAFGGSSLEQNRTIYDNVGRVLTRVRMLDADSSDPYAVATDHVVIYGYDDAGRTTAQTTFNMGSSTGHTSLSEYDGHGRLTKSINPKGFYDQTEYDLTGLVTARIEYDGRSRRTTMEYDADNQMTRSIAVGDPGTPNDDIITEYRYDSLGRRTKTIDPMERETVYQHDLLGRQIRMIEDAAAGGLNRTTEYQYSKQGLLTALIARNTTGDQTTFYRYSPAGLVATIRYPDGDDDTDNVKYAYYPNGSVSLHTQQDGTVLRYFYDDRGLLLTRGSASGDFWVTYAYDGLGRMITAQKGTSSDEDAESRSVYFYDDLSRVTHEQQKIGDANEKHIYMEYDQAGNRLRLRYPSY